MRYVYNCSEAGVDTSVVERIQSQDEHVGKKEGGGRPRVRRERGGVSRDIFRINEHDILQGV